VLGVLNPKISYSLSERKLKRKSQPGSVPQQNIQRVKVRDSSYEKGYALEVAEVPNNLFQQ
jgi:hypothetical protein